MRGEASPAGLGRSREEAVAIEKDEGFGRIFGKTRKLEIKDLNSEHQSAPRSKLHGQSQPGGKMGRDIYQRGGFRIPSIVKDRAAGTVNFEHNMVR